MPRSVKDWMEEGTREFPRTLPDDEDVPYLSPSQIRELLTCGARYKYKYVEDRNEAMDARAWFGIAVHDGLCEGFTKWVDTGIPPHPDIVADEAEDRLWEFLTEGGPDKVWEWDELTWTEVHSQCHQQARTISTLLLNWFKTNDWTPLEAEVEVSKKFRDFASYGWTDLVAEDAQGRVWILDFKTTGSTPAHGIARRIHQFQLSMYAGALEQEYDIHALAAVYAVRNKTPKVVFCPIPWHEGTKQFAEGIAHSAGDQIQFGELAPNPHGAGFICDPDRCGFWKECPGAPRHESETVDTGNIDIEVEHHG